ncbi:MAG: glycosyltransferase [bacterium]|nr:glycosyltransferase [bacterium]
MPLRNTLVIMAKTPSAGRVKTRLAADIGVSEALRFYRHQLVATCCTLANHPGWKLVLSRAPDHDRSPVRVPVDKVIGQGGGGLGVRMQRLFDTCGRGPLIIIGADIPGITPAMIARAFHILKGYDHVFGPAQDGGYWLVGQSRCPRVTKSFDNVRWSSSHALNDTLQNLAGSSVGYVDELNDVDTGVDL